MKYFGKLKQNIIFGNIFTFGSATLLSAVFAFIVGVVTRNLLGPEIYGYWLTVSMLFPFIPILQLGTLNAMNREIPFYLARKDHEKVKEIRNLTFSFIFTIPLLSILVLFLVGIILLFFPIGFEYKFGWISAAFIGVLMFVASYTEIYYKSIQDFKFASKLVLLKNMSQSILTIALVVWLGYEGLYLGLILSLILEIILGRRSFKGFKFTVNKDRYKELVKIGFPILLVGLVWSLMIASDRIIISIFMTPLDMGNYGVGMLVFSSMMLLPQVIGQVYYPKIVELVSVKEFLQIKNLAWKVNKVLAIVMGLIVVVGYFALPFFIKYLMPEYIEGTKAAQILLIGIFPLTLVSFAANYFNSTHNQKIYMSIQVISILLNVLISLVLLYFNKDIVSVALGTSMSNLIYCILMNSFFSMKIKEKIAVPMVE